MTTETVTETPLEAALLAIDQVTVNEPDSWRIAATCKGLIVGYDQRWREEQKSITLLDCEKFIQAPLPNIDTGHNSKTFVNVGFCDKLYEQNGLVLLDHKTTSMGNIDDPESPYWQQTQIDSQPSHYELILLSSGIRLNRIVWDVIYKPSIRPKNLSEADRKRVTSLGEYLGKQVSVNAQQEFATEKRENGELFAIRVAKETTEQPDKYFARRAITRSRQEIGEYAQELWQLSKEMLDTRRLNRHFRNSGACQQYGSPCKFLGICSGRDSPDSDKWQPRQQRPELQQIAKDTLSHSRIRCYQTCRRKHYYEYELGIERVEDDRRESLFFGSVFHAALNAWWIAASNPKEPNHGNCNESSGNEPDNCAAKAQAGLAG